MNKELAEAAGQAITEFLMENCVKKESLAHIVESQSNVIKKQREEIERFVDKQQTIELGDFKISMDIDCEIWMYHKGQTKHISPGEFFSALTKLYFRTEEKRSCLNCSMFVAMVDNRSPRPDWRCRFVEKEYIKCVENKFSHWQPKTT